MAIVVRKRNKGTTYQVKLKTMDGGWMTQTFSTRKEAERFELESRLKKSKGESFFSQGSEPTLNEFLLTWHEFTRHEISRGWRKDQLRYFNVYVGPIIGSLKLQHIQSEHIRRVLNEVANLGLSKQTQLHVYNLLHKMFEDAREEFQLVNFNPLTKRIKPKVVRKESRYLGQDSLRALLLAVKDHWIGPAVWIQTYLGLRVGEVQALKWRNVFLKEGRLKVEGTYVKKERYIKDYPKGGEQHTLTLPDELCDYLRQHRMRSSSEFVTPNTEGGLMDYMSYYKALRRIGREIGVEWVGTHGLRHSTSSLYLDHGATEDDIRRLFAHSNDKVTQIYLHDRGTRLERLARKISLFQNSEISPKVSPTAFEK